MAKTPYYTKAEADAKRQETFSEIKQNVQAIGAGEGGKMYDSLAEAQAVTPKPVDGTVFQVSKLDSGNAGVYTFQSGEVGGVRFERELFDPTTVKQTEFLEGAIEVFKPEENLNGGNSVYSINGLGLFQEMTKTSLFNKIEINAGVDVTAEVHLKIYEADALGGRNPDTDFALLYEDIQQWSENDDMERTIILSEPLQATKGKLIIILWSTLSPVNVSIGRWNTNIEGSPDPLSLNRMLLSVSSDYENLFNIGWSLGSPSGGYFSVPPKISLTANLATLNDLENLESRIESITPRLCLPEKITAVVGYDQQIFYRGIIESVNPYQWNIKINTDLNGNQFPRYYQFKETAPSTKDLTVSLYNDKNELVATKTTAVEIIAPIASPDTVKKVLCVGDSLTAGGVWTGEMLRMLSESGGTPEGLGLGNIELIGTSGSGTNLHEGHSGWTWKKHISIDSPFYNPATSEIDFQWYVDTYGFGTIDYLLTLLTWNGQKGKRATASDHAELIADAKTFLDRFHEQLPNAKVKLLGIPLPSMNGGLGDNYGDADSGYGNYYDLVQTVFGLNLAYEALVKEPVYSSFVSFENVSAQFDNENNMPEELTSVNLRSSKTEYRGTNGVHPDNEGYMQIADVAFRAFNSF